MADGTITVTIYNFAFSSLGTISSAFLPKGSFLRNDAGDGEFVFPLYDTPAKNLVQYNRIAVATVEDSGGNDVVVAAFHIRGINLRYVSSGIYEGYVVHVSGPGILHELSYDNLGYTTISNGSQGPTSGWFSDILAFAQNSWIGSSMGSLPTGVSNNAYLRTAGETVMDALQQAIAQTGRFLTYSPIFATLSTAALRRSIMFVNSPTIGSNVSGSRFQPLTLVKGATSTADECTVLDLEPIEETYEVATRVTAYGAGIGADVLTIADAQGLVTVPTGFTVVDWAESIIANSTLEAVSGQPQIHRLEQFGHIKSEDKEDSTANETAAIQLFWAAIYYLRDRQTARREFYRVTFIGYPGAEYSVGQLVRLTYSETSNIDGSGSANPTAVIDLDDDFVIHELSMQVPNSGKHQGKRVITALLGAEVTTSTYIRPLPTDDEVVVKKLKEHDEILRHATASASPSSPGGDGTYATADAPYLVLSNTTNLTNERAFAAGAGLAATDGGANSTYTVNVVAADTSLTINANDMQVRLAATSGLQVSSGLMIADTIAGAGLTISSKVLAVGAGDGIDVAADSIAVDVTDIIGNGLVEAATNNIALGTPSTLTASTANGVTTTSHTHAIDTTIARSAVTITGAGALGGGGDLTTSRTITLNTPGTLTVSSSNSSGTSHTHAITSSSAVSTATSTLLATDSNGRTQVRGLAIGESSTEDGLQITKNSGSPAVIITAATNGEIATPDGAFFRIGHWDGVSAFTERVSMDGNGALFVGDTADTKGTVQLVVNQGSNTDQILGLKASGYVAHGITDQAETDTWLSCSVVSGSEGGARFTGLRDGSGALAMLIRGIATAGDTTKSTAADAVVKLIGGKKSGTNGGALGTNENILAVADWSSTRWIVDKEGDTHRDGSDNTFDVYQDAHLARAFDRVISPGSVVDSEFDSWVQYGREDLIAAGILHESGFYNESRLLRLAVGAVWQEYTERKRLELRVNELERRLLN